MMDLLVKVATYNKIVPSGHVIKVLSEERRNVFYKPNTPVGLLDANTLYVVPKNTAELNVKKMPKLANQPFEQTFRLQINLPRNQRAVLRVSPQMTLAELKQQVCEDKELDPSTHHLVHPSRPDIILDLNSTLDIYGCAEISLLSTSGLRESIRCLSTQFIAYPQGLEEEKRKKGILRLFTKKKKELPGDNEVVESERHVSVAMQDNGPPKQSIKRKQAPAPPVLSSSTQQKSNTASSEAKSDELGSTVSHSRHSSDSSGYHEPSVFSDCSENKSPESSIVQGIVGNDSSKELSHGLKSHVKHKNASNDLTSLKPVPLQSAMISQCRKRKAPQPPTPVLHEVEDTVILKESIVEEVPLPKGGVPFSAGHLVEVIAETHNEPCDSRDILLDTPESINAEQDSECVESAGAYEDGVRCKETELLNGDIEQHIPANHDVKLSEGDSEMPPPLPDFLPEPTTEEPETSEREEVNIEEAEEIKAEEIEVLEPAETEELNIPTDGEESGVVLENEGLLEPAESIAANVKVNGLSDCTDFVKSNETPNVQDAGHLNKDVPPVISKKIPNFIMRCYGDEVDATSGGLTSPEVVEEKKVIPSLVGSRSAPQVQIISFQERRALVDEASTRLSRRRRSSSAENCSFNPTTVNSVITYNPSHASGIKRTISEQNINNSLVIDIGQDHQLLLRNDSGVQSGFFSSEVPTNMQCSVTQEEIHMNGSMPSLNHSNVPSALTNDSRKVLSEDSLKTCTLPRVSISHHKPNVIFSTLTVSSSSEERSRPNGMSDIVRNSSGESTVMSDRFKIPDAPSCTGKFIQTTKSETLPRPVIRSRSAFDASKSGTLKKDISTSSQLVTIGSWDQRNTLNINSDTVASSRSMFQSLENIPLEQHKTSVTVHKKSLERLPINGHGNNDKVNSKDVKIVPSVSISVKERPDTLVKKVEKHSISNDKSHHRKFEAVKQQPQMKTSKKSAAMEIFSKSSKPLVRLLSMKDEPQPSRSLYVLKKWPLPETNETHCSKRGGETVVREEHNKTKHAEVNLRKIRSSKSSSTVSPQSSSSTEHTEQHGTKVDTSDMSSDSGSGSNSKTKPPVNVTFRQQDASNREKFNLELKNIISKRASLQKESVSSSDSEPTYSEAKSNNNNSDSYSSETNGVMVPPPPPPPPPVSTMPPIPAAVPIPLSSQLLMQKKIGTSKEPSHKDSKKPKPAPSIAPREELMLEIRGFGGRQALRKSQPQQPNWNMKVYGSKMAMNYQC